MLRRWLLAAALGFSLSPRPSRADEKRPLPDYDGRPSASESAAWWVPRVALYPFWLVHEYGVRKPLRAVVLIFDRDAARGPSTRDRFDVRPLVVLDYGFKPRLGMQVTIHHGDSAFRGRADTFGSSSFRLGGALLLTRESLSGEIYGELIRRPDTIFHGLGPRSQPDDRVRVALERGDVGSRVRAVPTQWLQVDALLSMRGVAFRTPGVERDYAAFAQRLSIRLDPRPVEAYGIALKDEFRRKNGVHFMVDGELAESPLPARTWAAYAGTALATFDVTGTGRVLELATVAEFVDPLSGGAPPYTEHVTLGGERYLRGHLPGRLFGRSALVAYAEWRWPAWSFLEGFVRVDTGNVFGAHLQEFSPRLLRLSATTGMRTLARSGYLFELLAGVGTETFEDRAHVSSVRLLLSANQPLWTSVDEATRSREHRR